MVLHIVLFVYGPHLKSVTLVTLQAVKLESDNVIVLFLAFESSLEDLVVLKYMVRDLVMVDLVLMEDLVVMEDLIMEVMVMEDLVKDLVMYHPARSIEWNGIRVASELPSSHSVLVIVHALGPL